MFALLGREANRRLREAHIAHGLTPQQFHILGLLHDHGPLGQTDLAARTQTAASMLVTQLNPLEADGLVSRQRDAADRRRHVVLLTEAGRERLREAGDAQRAVEDELFGVLTAGDRAELTRLLALLRDDMTGGNAHCATPSSLGRPEG
ncbi:winged helix-turn-helix transcriptional regulator [Cryptosporangium phraense]|uniref:Winged helix-turn-helix transcriptional regulator n=2 Tax=Cryptosporangium phraense TaxID=2593070 RepID=A0A545AMP8_9ACTN|nr:winged helix-turn-helix transcriptional regulator [Cryptosporangium phraense]